MAHAGCRAIAGFLVGLVVKFEVRVPTFERPAMLSRALRSLREQTCSDWSAIVHDDSRTAAAQEVVASLADSRIRYSRNPGRLGAAANIDQCFAPAAQAGGDHACLLEDDNFWQPTFLETAAEALRSTDAALLLMDQRINDEGAGLRSDGATTRGGWFVGDRVDPLELRASLMFMEGISNGGLVWRLGAGPDLRVGSGVAYTGLQEACRSLLIKQPLPFVRRADAVWTALPKAQTARRDERNRLISRGMQSVRQYVLRRHGRAIVDAAATTARRLGLEGALAAAVWHSAGAQAWQWRDAVGLDTRALLKGVALRATEPDPCRAFLDTRGPG
jgi:glycosyltransferase involved in cell wall biosynthesis